MIIPRRSQHRTIQTQIFTVVVQTPHLGLHLRQPPIPVLLLQNLVDDHHPPWNPNVPQHPPDRRKRQQTDSQDHELISFKSDARARPAWKTIGLRLKRDPEACKARWIVLRQNMRELNPRTEPEAED